MIPYLHEKNHEIRWSHFLENRLTNKLTPWLTTINYYRAKLIGPFPWGTGNLTNFPAYALLTNFIQNCCHFVFNKTGICTREQRMLWWFKNPYFPALCKVWKSFLVHLNLKSHGTDCFIKQLELKVQSRETFFHQHVKLLTWLNSR